MENKTNKITFNLIYFEQVIFSIMAISASIYASINTTYMTMYISAILVGITFILMAVNYYTIKVQKWIATFYTISGLLMIIIAVFAILRVV